MTDNPDWAREVRMRLSSLRLSPTREAEVVEELSQHLDDRYHELIAGGASPEEAARQAIAGFRSGDLLARQMAELRQAHVSPPIAMAAPTAHALTDLRQDLRHAARVFVKRPGFAAAAVLTLALGIGATTAIFSVVYGVLLKPLSFHQPERIVDLRHRIRNGEGRNHGPDTYLTYRDHQRAFEAIGAWDRKEVSITAPGEPERVTALAVTSTTLPLLGVRPAVGRFFTKEDDTPGAPLRVILTHGYWQRRFGGATTAIGQAIQIDGRPADVIGVLPASFKFPRINPVVLLPMPLVPANGIVFDFQVVGRLKPGVSIAAANADVGRMIPMLHPSFERLQMRPYVRPLSESVVGNIGSVLWILFAAVGLVLLIACGNVANLFLVRAEGRQQELAMRAALGASAGRIARVLLSESMLLALGGGALGLAFSYAAVGVLRRMAPPQLPRLDEIAIDPMVMLFALALSIAAGLLFGLLPVLRFARPNPAALKDGGRTSSDAPGRQRTRDALVVAEIALAMVLMVVSGLMIRTVVLMLDVSPGFTRPEEVQTFRLSVPESLAADDQLFARTLEQIQQRLAQVPGVTSAGLASAITMDGENNGNALELEGFPVREGNLAPLWRFRSFAPGYFETMGNRLVAGRSVTWAEIHGARPVVLVSEALARQYWTDPSQAIGTRARTGANVPWREIVGVVGNERDDGLDRPPTAMVYWPLLNDSYQQRTVSYAVRSSRVGTPGFMRELQEAVWSVNAKLPLAAVQTLEEIRATSMARTSFVMVMLAIAASVALILSVIGIYAVITYIARQRTREIGVRMALGAQIGDVRQLFLRHALRLTAIGIIAGIVGAVMITRVMSALLFGVGPMDPATFIVVSSALAAVALFASYLPARRASRVDPVVALRADA
jgi:putative ABC transport system permease protein